MRLILAGLKPEDVVGYTLEIKRSGQRSESTKSESELDDDQNDLPMVMEERDCLRPSRDDGNHNWVHLW